MPSFFKVAAAAAFATMASAQAFTNGTSGPSAVNGIAGWNYAGCFALDSAFAGVLVETNFNQMTVERCTLDCSAYQFAALVGSSCFCAGVITPEVQVSEASCRTRCPGNPNEACGGPLPNAKRQAIAGVASVYQKVVVPAGVIYTTVITNIFLDFCPVCVGGVSSITYSSTATLTGCGCPTPSVPSIPVYTTTVACPSCGPNNGPSTVVVTVPTGCTAGASTSVVTVPVTTVTVCPGCVSSAIPPPVSTAVVPLCPGCSVVTTSVCPGCPVTTITRTATPTPTGGVIVVTPAPLCPGCTVVTATPCPGCAPTTITVTPATATPATATRPATFTGAANAHKAGGLMMAAGIAAALL